MKRSSGTALKGARILILEDEFFIADDLARALRANGAEPVGPASTVKQAEALVARERLDAAILDLNLCGNMASTFVERLVSANLPCLIMSGYGDDAVPESLSGVPRMEKPVDPASVLDQLSAELGRPGSDGPPLRTAI